MPRSKEELSNERTVILEDDALRQIGGFTQVPNFILTHPKISYGAKVTYSVLLKYAWQKDFCFPAQKKLAEDLNASDRQIRRFLTELKKADLITWKQRGLNRPNIYYLKSIITAKSPDRTNMSTPDRTYRSGQERTNMSTKEYPIEEYKTLNVRKKSVDNSSNDEARAIRSVLVSDIVNLCGDGDRSLGFYRLVANKIPEELIRTAISEVKALKLERTLKGTPGQAFTYLIQKKAQEAGIKLGTKKGGDRS